MNNDKYLEDVLNQENLIKEKENKRNSIIIDYNNNKNCIKNQKKNMLLLPIVTISSCFLIVPLSSTFLIGDAIAKTALGDISLTALLTILISSLIIPACLISTMLEYKEYKKTKKQNIKLYSEISNLEKQLKMENEKLSNINNKNYNLEIALEDKNKHDYNEMIQSNIENNNLEEKQKKLIKVKK